MKTKFLTLFLTFLMFGCAPPNTQEEPPIFRPEIPEVDHEYFEVEYLMINWEDIFNENIEQYYIYVYSLTCSHCQELKNWIIEKAIDRGDIFFVKGTNKIPIKNDVNETIGATTAEDVSILGFPSLLKIVGKTVTKNVAGNSKIISLLS